MRTIDEAGNQVTNLDEMKSMLVGYFTELYDCENKERPILEIEFSSRLSPEWNAWMRVFPNETEIRNALLSMVPNK